MNVCVVSTFDGTTDDYMEKFQEVMSSEEMQAWDTKFNCVDEVYSLEKNN